MIELGHLDNIDRYRHEIHGEGVSEAEHLEHIGLLYEMAVVT